VEAAITGSAAPFDITTANLGKVRVSAEDQSEIDADAGGAAVNLSQSQRDEIKGAIAAAIAVNSIDNDVLAHIDPTAVESAGNVEVEAVSNPDIFALALGISTTVATGGSSSGGFSFDLAGAVAYNEITDSVTAEIVDSTVTAGGDVLVSAKDTAKILAITGAGSVIISSSSGAAIGLSIAINEIQNHVLALVDNSTINAGGKVEVKADGGADIDAWAIAGAGSVSTGSTSLLVHFEGAGAVTINTIRQHQPGIGRESDHHCRQ
jgi:hypothetical protein